jgi:predicted nucleic acid-binding protein
MIAIDTSSLIAYLRGETGSDVESVDDAFRLNQAVLPPVVITEILSDPRLDPGVARLIRELPVLEIHLGYWERARLADTLITQSCLDHETPLVTRDADFRHFAAHAGLILV